MFSDETERGLFDRGRRHLDRFVNDMPMIIDSRSKLSGGRNDSVNLYECTNCTGFVPTELLEGTLYAEAYIDILDRRVPENWRSEISIHRGCINVEMQHYILQVG